MSDLDEPKGTATGSAGEEERVANLLREAGRRPEVPADELAAIKLAFRAAWQERHGRGAEGVTDRAAHRASSRGNRRPAWRPWLAVAAALVAGLGLAWWWGLGPGAGTQALARVEAVMGPVTVHPAGEADGTSRLAAGMELAAGATVETADAGAAGAPRAALRLADGHSLRIDSATRVHLAAASALSLEHGAVYLDSGGRREAESVTVRTPLGVARSLGTQFEVRLLDGEAPAMRLRVREGQVRLEAGEAGYAAGPGVQLTLHGDGSVTRGRINLQGSPWQWAVAAAPPLEIEGLALGEFLAWVARETGWEVRYASPELEAAAREIVLHGSMGELPPDQAPGAVLPGAGLSYRVESGVLTVRRAPGDGAR